jgi:hypothetical protein
MATAVFGIAKNETQANDVVGRLKSGGFLSTNISVLFPDRSGSRDFAHEHNTKMPEGAAAGAGTGGALGGVLGLLAGIGALAIPGVGPLIAAGPIMAALSGIAVGAAVGGLAGGLIGLGIPEIEARRYEGKIKEGNILISVHTENGDEVKRAKETFEGAGATDITTTTEKAPPEKKDPPVPETKRPNSNPYTTSM